MTKQTGPVDAYTYDRARRVLATAKMRGHDPVEALHRAGLLLSAQMELDLKADGVSYVLGRMKDHRVADFLRRKHQNLTQRTPSDLYVCITDWLEELIPAIRKGPL